jgi:hypothetical protein
MLRKLLLGTCISIALVLAGLATPAYADGTAVVSGTVTSGGNPIASAEVSVYPVGTMTGAVAGTTTAPDGTYSVSVPLGTWDFVFTPPAPFSPVTKSALVVTANQQVDVVLVQQGVGLLSGRLVDDQGTPAPGGVSIQLSGSPGSYSATTRSDGTFQFAARNGSYSLAVNSSYMQVGDAPQPYWQLTTGAGFVVDGDANLGDVALPAPERLVVTVLDPDGQPVAGASVSTPYLTSIASNVVSVLGLPVTSGYQYDHHATTDSTGTAIIKMWPDTATVSVTPPAGGRLLPATTPPLTITTNTTTTVHLDAAALLSGRLVDDQGTPAPGGVSIQLSGSPGSYSATTRSDGTFQFAARNGSYSLAVNSSYMQVGDAPQPYWQLTTGAGFVVDGDANLGDVALPAPERLVVTVLDPDGQPVAGASVSTPYLTSIASNVVSVLGLPVTSGYQYDHHATTDSTGTAIIKMWPDTATVSVTPPAGGRLLPATTPPLTITTDVDLLLAYQNDGSTAILTGAADTYQIFEGHALDVAAPGVLANDQAPTGSDPQATVVDSTAHGELAFHSDGSFHYTPAEGFSGVDHFTYRINANALRSEPISVTVVVLSDTIPPNVTGAPDRSPTNGWFNGPVTITWTATDPSPSSGTPTTPSPTTISAEGANQVVTSGLSCDPGGNCASGHYTVSIDRTAPVITTTMSPIANGDGWNNTDVTVTFTCTDALSGIATCPVPVVVNADGAARTVTGTALDKAGNTASTTVVVNLDKIPPGILATVSPTVNGDGWNNTDVTVTFTCTDALSGIATCPVPVVVNADGAARTVTGTALDKAGNTASTTVVVNLDKTAPVLGAPVWSANPKAVGSSTVLTVPTIDAVSGVVGGEYFLDTDPGIGNGIAMTYGGGNLTATIGIGLAVGVYRVGIRGKDAAGNWSLLPDYTMLVVYDPSITVGITGKNKNDLVPSLASGDVLPGLASAGQTDTADYGFTVDYNNGALDPKNDFMVAYNTGTQCNTPHPQNCHSLMLSATGFEWMIIDQVNNSRGRFQGSATINVDGVTTTNPFTVEGIDGDRLTPATDDHFLLKIYAVGADPGTSPPIYQASGYLTKGNSVRVR